MRQERSRSRGKSSDERTYLGFGECTSSLDVDYKVQFNEPLPLPVAVIDVEPCECCASTDPEPLLETLRPAVDGAGLATLGAEAWFALVRAGAAALSDFVGDLVCADFDCDSAFGLAQDDVA